MDYKERTIFSGSYRGIVFEFTKFPSNGLSGRDNDWCHYVYLYDTQVKQSIELPKLYFTSFGTQLSREPSWVHNLEFHGGCTYCEIERKDHLGTLLKIGCDYQHYWDEGRDYSDKFVYSEVKRTIDSMYGYFGDIKTVESLHKDFRGKFPGQGSFGIKFDVQGHPIEEST